MIEGGELTLKPNKHDEKPIINNGFDINSTE